MKTVTLSNRFYYRELDEQDAQAIKNDILLYNRMIRKAYKLLTLKFQGVPWEFDSLLNHDISSQRLRFIKQKTKGSLKIFLSKS